MKLKPLVIMMALLPVMAVPTSTAVFASDLGIYRGNTAGKTNIFLMLDTSGSMGVSSLVMPRANTWGSPGDVDSSLCTATGVPEYYSNLTSTYLFNEWQYNYIDTRATTTVNGVANAANPTYNKPAFYNEVTVGGLHIPYYTRGCGSSITGKYDRLSRLKNALIPLLAGDKLSNNVIMGVGNFSSRTDLNVSVTSQKLVDGHSGNVLVPAAPLDQAQRIRLIQAIANIKSLDTTTNENGTSNNELYLSNRQPSSTTTAFKKASSGTPSAHAYAEAGAYMMGTTTGTRTGNVLTSTPYVYDGYTILNKGTDQVYMICVELGPTLTNALGGTNNVKQCINAWPQASRKTYSTTGYTLYAKPTSPNKGTKYYYAKDPSKTTTNNPPIYNENKYKVDTNGNEIVEYGTGTLSNVYQPNGSGGWTSVTYPSSAIELSPDNVWGEYKNLPAGWRFGGWMKVPNEPMDIEPVTGTVWGSYAGAQGLFIYRTNPLSLDGNDNLDYIVAANGANDKVGGFAYSNSGAKEDATKYYQSGSTSSCDGNGIYFLTDGAPNSTKVGMAEAIMNKTLKAYRTTASSYTRGTETVTQVAQTAKADIMCPTTDGLVSPTLKSNLFAGETGRWECIGEYAKRLRDKTLNPTGVSIKTAVVGFGSSFEGLTLKPDGTYDCNSTANLDIKNACLWGSKGAGYGEGGFYQANNSEDIVNSILKFVEDLKVDFTPSSLGSISVPRDPLDQTKYMTEGFFPMVMPMEDSTFRTWAGNLKKYNIVGGTLKDSSGNAIYKVENNQQLINSTAKDLWSNATTGTDHSLINSGGAWNKIPVPSTAQETVDAISNINSERKVYILDGSSLKKVTPEKLATNFTGTGALTGSYTVNQRLALLNYLGYKTIFPATATQTTLTNSEIALLAVNPVSPYRFLGGVIHSTPLMVTKESTVSSNNAVGTREQYTVYGSMEGGLHIVDSSTGKEKAVFVPQEILSNQYDTLANGDSKGVGSLTGTAYGVDAPWVADNTFKVQTTTSNSTAATKYIANKMNIYGGLRMGGKAIYGLDILTPASPELLFNITPATTGFGRLAQIWSKPTVAEIRVKGIRTKVLIFGGGYDADAYEKPAASFTEPSSTYGNALYVVDATTGALIWMSSSDTSGVADAHKKTIQSDLKYSVVGQPVVRDYDADGLTDMIYFADLGGQIFRVDLNNNNQMSKTVDTKIAIRVQPLAQLRTTGVTPFVPRFYDRLSTAVFDDGQNRFVLVTAGSGNRSFPLEAENGGKNKIYGLIDRDAAADGLEKSAFTPAPVITPDLLSNTGILGKTVTKQITDTEIAKMKLITGSTMLRGWSFELRSVDTGNYARSFEESQLITGDLYVSLYDPKATLTGTVNGCGGGVTGISTTHRICMPYGDCAAYIKTSYQGINGPAFGVVNASDPRKTSLVGPIAETKEVCIGKCPAEKTALTEQNLPTYSQVRKIKPVRWFEW